MQLNLVDKFFSTKRILFSFLYIFIFINLTYSKNNDILNPIVGIPVVYTINSSDTLFDIARKFNVGIRHIKIANGLKVNKIKEGEKIIIPTQHIIPKIIDNGIVINIPELNLYFFEDKKVQFISPVAVGKNSRLGRRLFQTPVGEYKIIGKIKNPTWLPPEWAGIEKPVPPGPKNPLGDRWIALSKKGYGIHSTNKLSSIGSPVSHGCIRLYPEDAEKIYNLVEVGTPVHIIYEPVKFGIFNGKIYIEVHPDIYKKSNFEIVTKKIEDLGILEYIDMQEIKKIFDSAKGIPISIFGSDIEFFFVDEKIPIKFQPIIFEKKIWVEISSLVSAFESDMNVIEDKNLMEIYYEGLIIHINLDSGDVISNEYSFGNIEIRKIANSYFAPVDSLVKIFGFDCFFDKTKKRVYIY